MAQRLAFVELEARFRHAIPRWTPWIRKGGFAILDQGLFAGANFITSIFLARWLEPGQYGAFATAYSIFLLLGTFHTAILTEPMLVFGAGKYGEWFREYMGLLLYGHTALTALVSLMLAGTGLLFLKFESVELGQAFLGLGIAGPLILLTWLLRRACYVQSRPQWAAAGGGLYLVLMMIGIYVVYQAGWLSSLAALLVMGAAGAIVGGWMVWLLRPRWRQVEGGPTPRTVLANHWTYGKWSTAAAGLSWFPSNIYYALLPIWVGLEGSAALKAMQNFIMPVLLAMSAGALILVPEFVKAIDRGRSVLGQRVRLALTILIVLAGMYWLLLLFGGPIVTWLYNGRYDGYTEELILMGLLPFGASVVSVLGGALRALERPDLVFRCYIVSSAVTLTLGLALLATQGVAGAVLGLLASSASTGMMMLWFYLRAADKRFRC
mgnify:CR=1 FL=1